MTRKPGSMYHSIKQQVYTRKELMGGVPTSRITQFVSGNKKGFFPVQLNLHTNESCQNRHTALESARITTIRTLEKNAGLNDFRLKIRVYPHPVLRENKQATGAGANRVSRGMRASFGKIVGTAARVHPNQVIMSFETFKRNIEYAKDTLRKATSKLLLPCFIKFAS